MNFTQQQVSEILIQLASEQNGYQQILKYSLEAINPENALENLLRVRTCFKSEASPPFLLHP
jgi:hypothetical protein